MAMVRVFTVPLPVDEQERNEVVGIVAKATDKLPVETVEIVDALQITVRDAAAGYAVYRSLHRAGMIA